MVESLMIYFDHAASSPVYPEVQDILLKAFRDDFANPSSQHILGHDLQEKIEVIRDSFLRALGASKSDFFLFTSSATESNNTVIKGFDLNPQDIVLYCKADHPSLTETVKSLKATLVEIELNNDGTINREKFQSSLNENVKLVLLTHVNNQSGVVEDIFSIAKLVKEKSKAHVHIDAVQSFGKIPFKLNPAIDSVSVTSHKLGGPKGVAGLFLKEGHKVKPLLLGGGHEHGMRSSTSAYPLIAGFSEAAAISVFKLERSLTHVQIMNERIKSELLSKIPVNELSFKTTSPYIISFILPGISSDIILRHLETREVYISSTSACSSKIAGFNSSLKAMNISEKFHKNFLRISLGPNTTEDEVSTLIKEFIGVWDSLKHMQKR